MGIFSRMSTVFKAKMSRLLDRMENPNETLDYSYERQLEMLRKVKQGITEVVASKKRLELQAGKLKQEAARLETQAREALSLGREDLARRALEQRSTVLQQIGGLEQQIAEIEKEQQKLEATEAKLRSKVDAFRSQKELIKARYSAAEAQVKIGEAATGLSEELADIGMAIERAERKTDNMKARAAAIDELVESGVLDDVLAPKDEIDRELAKLKSSKEVESELERLKKEVAK